MSSERRRGGIVERDGEAHERAHVREALRSWKEIPPSLGPLSQYVTTLHFDARGAADKATVWCSYVPASLTALSPKCFRCAAAPSHSLSTLRAYWTLSLQQPVHIVKLRRGNMAHCGSFERRGEKFPPLRGWLSLSCHATPWQCAGSKGSPPHRGASTSCRRKTQC